MRSKTATLRRLDPENAGKSLTQSVQDTILSWIRQGKYQPGSQFPSVPELVRQMDVSRTVVREALQSLVGMNLIEMRPGLGCFVKAVPSDLILNADVLASLLGMEAIAEVVAARRVIESAIARLAAVEATEDDFDEMEQILRKIGRAAEKNQPMYAATPLFHNAVARATHNKVLEKIVTSFNLLMASGGALIERENVGSQYRMQEYESHRQLYEVLRKRDPDAAQRAMEEHIGLTLEILHTLTGTGRVTPNGG